MIPFLYAGEQLRLTDGREAMATSLPAFINLAILASFTVFQRYTCTILKAYLKRTDILCK